ncbi:TPA: hypothetical protein ACXYLK_003338 [Legionella pneumophila]|nr:hypothetical protein [Legionella anisa]MCW8426793.1 hypothetical protein [Legionella anisa]MCW8449538.1 hypothetical protein [Legionella anisa]
MRHDIRTPLTGIVVFLTY